MREGSAGDRREIERLAAGTVIIGFPGREIPQGLIDRGVRNFILFAENIGDAAEVRALTAELRARAGADALIAIDHEGGRVNRLAATGAASPFPAAMAWAATGGPDLVRRASYAAATELAALGIDINFAPVVDILADHRNPALGTRCFSDDPAVVASYGAAFVEGHRQAGIAATVKHFAGHGETPVDSHLGLPEIGKSLEHLQAEDLVPFRAAVAAGAAGIMLSHAWYRALDAEPTPASISPVVARLAREMAGDGGVLVTDCMAMGAIQRRVSTGLAAVRALQAGLDLVAISRPADLQHEALDAIVEAVMRGELPRARLEEAKRRVDGLRRQAVARHRYRASPGDDGAFGDVSQESGHTGPPLRGIRLATDASLDGASIAREIARRAVTLVQDEQGIVPLDRTETLGVVAFAEVTGGVEGATAVRHPRLPERVMLRRPAARPVIARPDTDPEEILTALADVETVLVGTAFVVGRPWQAAVVETLQRAGKRLVVLALADPFDLLAFPDVPCYLVSYDETPLMLDAALDVVFGEREATGCLPVALPGLYPRGHHLSVVC